MEVAFVALARVLTDTTSPREGRVIPNTASPSKQGHSFSADELRQAAHPAPADLCLLREPTAQAPALLVARPSDPTRFGRMVATLIRVLAN